MKKIIVVLSLLTSMPIFAAPQIPTTPAPESSVSGQRGKGVSLSSTPRWGGGSAPSIAVVAIDAGVNSAVQNDNTAALATAEVFDVAPFCF